MRNLSEVINRILSEVPATEEDLIEQLKDVLNSLAYSAPENILMWWDETHCIIMDYVPDPPKEKWQWIILSIFSTKPIKELKKLSKEIAE